MKIHIGLSILSNGKKNIRRSSHSHYETMHQNYKANSDKTDHTYEMSASSQQQSQEVSGGEYVVIQGPVEEIVCWVEDYGFQCSASHSPTGFALPWLD